MRNEDTGILLNANNIKLQRNYFNQMVNLLGIQVIYRAPRENKSYNGYGELDSFYYGPQRVGCIFEEHPTQHTMRKLGWNSELETELSLIHVPYDLPGIQKGALFIIPSGIDNAEGRLFRVEKMSSICVYPASILCAIGPVWTNTYDESLSTYTDSNFNLLAESEEES